MMYSPPILLLRRLHRAVFPRRTAPSYCYQDNPQYDIRLDLHQVYQQPAELVMLGDSHVAHICWNELLNRNDVANRGIGQDVTAGMLARIAQVIAMRPKVCCIMGGINDIEKKISIYETLNNMTKMVMMCKDAGIRPVITSVVHVTRGYPDQTYNPRITRLNDWLQGMADRQQIAFMDLNEILAPLSYLLNGYALFDGTHLNSRGYLVWKEAIEQLIFW